MRFLVEGSLLVYELSPRWHHCPDPPPQPIDITFCVFGENIMKAQ